MRGTITRRVRFQSIRMIFLGALLLSAVLSGCGGVSDGSLDEDRPAIKLLSGTFMFSENASKASLGSLPISLATAPNGNVVLDIASSDEGEVIPLPQTLTFTPGNWNMPQIVYLQGIDDDEIDGNQTCKITVKVNTDPKSTADTTGYKKLGSVVQEVTVLDDDQAAVTVSPTTLTLSERETADFNIRLNTIPNGDVVIDLPAIDYAEATTNGITSLTFNAENWDQNQIVTVEGIDNLQNDGDLGFSIELIINAEATTDTTGYAEVAVPKIAVTVTEALAGVNVIPGTTTFSEDGSDGSGSFLVNLKSRPDGEVVLDIKSQDTTEATVDKSQITFTPENWSAKQTLLIHPVDDDLVDGNTRFDIVVNINKALTVDTTGYTLLDDSAVDDVPVTVIDNDKAGLTVIEPEVLTFSENGGAISIGVRLNSQPNGTVSILVGSTDITEATVDIETLIFSQEDWSTEKTVTISGEDDFEIDGNQEIAIALGVNQSETTDTTGYAELTPAEVPDVNVIVTDDDTAGVTVTPESLTFLESGSGEFTVELNTIPDGTVLIDVISLDTAEAKVNTKTLSFSHLNWSIPKKVIVSGVDEYTIDGNQNVTVEVNINAGSTTDTTGYKSVDVNNVAVEVLDNDTAGVTVTPGTTNFSENGGSGSFSVQLNTEPAGEVILAVASSDLTEAQVSPELLTFTANNWQTKQSVTITGIDDQIADGNQTFPIYVDIDQTTTDTNYKTIAIDDVQITVQDDDTAGVTVTPGITTFSENGGNGDFAVQLNIEPISDVYIAVSSTDAGEATVNQSLLTFTASDWKTAQIVTVNGVDDTELDGDQTVGIVIDIDSATTAPGYSDLLPEDVHDVTVTVTDDEAPK